VSKARRVELTRSGGGTEIADPGIKVFVDGVSGDIACARITRADFVDYAHLIPSTTRWKIVHILFHGRRPASRVAASDFERCSTSGSEQPQVAT
jgi:hypothetical protein